MINKYSNFKWKLNWIANPEIIYCALYFYAYEYKKFAKNFPKQIWIEPVWTNSNQEKFFFFVTHKFSLYALDLIDGYRSYQSKFTNEQ